MFYTKVNVKINFTVTYHMSVSFFMIFLLDCSRGAYINVIGISCARTHTAGGGGEGARIAGDVAVKSNEQSCKISWVVKAITSGSYLTCTRK